MIIGLAAKEKVEDSGDNKIIPSQVLFDDPVYLQGKQSLDTILCTTDRLISTNG